MITICRQIRNFLVTELKSSIRMLKIALFSVFLIFLAKENIEITVRKYRQSSQNEAKPNLNVAFETDEKLWPIFLHRIYQYDNPKNVCNFRFTPYSYIDNRFNSHSTNQSINIVAMLYHDLNANLTNTTCGSYSAAERTTIGNGSVMLHNIHTRSTDYCRSSYYICRIDRSSNNAQSITGLVVNLPNYSFTLKIVKIEPREPKNTIEICVPAIFDYDNWLHLISFVEFQRSIGVQKLTIYVHSASPQVMRVLNYYASLKILTLINWSRILVNSFDRTSYYGQSLQMQDCNLRSSKSTRFLLHQDLDEFLIQTSRSGNNTENWLRIYLDTLGAEYSRIGAFVIRSAFYNYVATKRRWELSTTAGKEPVVDKHIAISSAMMRNGDIFAANIRSKSIVRPDSVLRQAVHFVMEYKEDYSTHHVPINSMLFYHMRTVDPVNQTIIMGLRKGNFSFEAQLLKRVNKVIQEIPDP